MYHSAFVLFAAIFCSLITFTIPATNSAPTPSVSTTITAGSSNPSTITVVTANNSSSNKRRDKIFSNSTSSGIIRKNECAKFNLSDLINKSSVILRAFCGEIYSNSDNTNDNGVTMNSDVSHSSTNGNTASTTSAENENFQLNLLPKTVFKGEYLIRKLESFKHSQFYVYDGQLNATLDPPKRCYDNKILKQLPGQLIVFGKINMINNKNNKNKKSRTQILILPNGLIPWSQDVEDEIWKKLGWSEWSDFSACSVTCGKGVQQRYRYCLHFNDVTPANSIYNATTRYSSPAAQSTIRGSQQNRPTKERPTTEDNKSQQDYRSSCGWEGYNIEQRNCNMFKCKGAIDLLFHHNATRINSPATSSSSSSSTSIPSISSSSPTSRQENIQVLEGRFIKLNHELLNFTLLIIIHLKSFYQGNIFTLRSAFPSFSSNNHETTESLSLELIDNKFKILQEKSNFAESFEIHNGMNSTQPRIYYLAISIQNGNLIINYVDCLWESTYVVSKGFITLSTEFFIHFGSEGRTAAAASSFDNKTSTGRRENTVTAVRQRRKNAATEAEHRKSAPAKAPAWKLEQFVLMENCDAHLQCSPESTFIRDDDEFLHKTRL